MSKESTRDICIQLRQMMTDHISQDNKDKAVMNGRVIKCENGIKDFARIKENVAVGFAVGGKIGKWLLIIILVLGVPGGAVAAINHFFGSIGNLLKIMGG